MVSWILLILVVVGMILFFKTTGVRFGKTWTFLIGAIIFFFVITFAYIMIQVGEANTFDGFTHTVRTYFIWLNSLLDNVATIGGEVTSVDWGGNVTGE